MTAKGMLNPQNFPPTARASYFHGLRVHHQVRTWSLEDDELCDPTQWGWVNVNNRLSPKMTDLDVAPLEVKQVIKCKCKSESVCGTYSCRCRKLGLKCISLCEGCRGEDCSNADVRKFFYL